MSSARVRLPDRLERLTTSEMEAVIREANLGVYDTGIANRYLIEQIPQIDIAAEYGCVRSTISTHVSRIVSKAIRTAERLGMD